MLINLTQVFFTDIVDFTTIAEKLDLPQLMQILQYDRRGSGHGVALQPGPEVGSFFFFALH
jgi:hypothetical protein